MGKYFKILLACLVLSFVLLCCERNNEKNDDKNILQFNKESSSIKKGQLVFVGDSITEWGELDKYYKLTSEVYNKGIASDTVDGLINRMKESVYDLEPNYIVFLMGINDIFRGYSDEQLLENYHTVFKGIKDKLPDSKVLIQSVYPVVSEDNYINERIIGINKELSKIAEIYGYQYVDVWSKLIVEGTIMMNPKYVSDGLHPNDEGYKKAAEILNPIIEKLITE